jgi:hypothetical protein
MAIFSLIENAQYIWLTVPVLMFFLSIAYPTLSSIVSNRTHADNQGEVLGVYHSIQGCAMGLSPMFAGSFIGAFPTLTGWGGASMMLAGCLAFWIGYRTPALSTKAVNEL